MVIHEIAAFAGRVVSLYKIGDMYRNGYYLERDGAEAFRIYSRCLDLVNSDSENVLECGADVCIRMADCYLNAIGCHQNALTALYWASRAEFVFRRREERNDPYARHGIEWAMDTITKCRYILDGHQYVRQPV